MQKWRIITDEQASYYLVPAEITPDDMEAWEDWCHDDDETRGEWLGFDFEGHHIGDDWQDIIFALPERSAYGSSFGNLAISDSHPAFATS